MTLYKAMAAAFPKIEGALKDNENEAFKRGGKATKYADLASVVNAVKPALSDQKLFFIQMTHEQQGGVCVETIVCHESGEQMSFGKLFVPAVKNDAQGYGSALTYARRYSLMTAFGVCPEDDDGNAAVKSGPDRITPAQELKLEDLARDVGIDLSKFLIAAKVASGKAKDLEADRFDAAIEAIEKRRKPKVDPAPKPSDELNGDEIPY